MQTGQSGQSATSLVGRWKELKLSGQIGSPGQKDKLTYSALSFQMESARLRGFTEPEIVAAVIRAITPGEDLRTYLEMTTNLTLPILSSILKSHFKEKDATSVFTELSNGAQLPAESENDFCLRMMGLRQKVLMMSAEEDGQYTVKLVQGQFQKSLSTGFRRESVRQQLRGVLRLDALLDVQLLKEVSDVVMLEAEHDQKEVNGKKSVHVVAAVDASPKSTQKATNPIIAEITKLTTQVSQLTGMQSGMQADLEQMRRSLQWSPSPNAAVPPPAAVPAGHGLPPAGGFSAGFGAAPPLGRGRGSRTWGVARGQSAGRGWGGRPSGPSGVMACPPCHQANVTFCRHCFYCGDDVRDHRVANCPKRLEDDQKNVNGGQC